MKRTFQILLLIVAAMAIVFIGGYLIPTSAAGNGQSESEIYEVAVVSYGHHSAFVLPFENEIYSWDSIFDVMPQNTSHIEFS